MDDDASISILNRFELRGVLGNGSAGPLYRARDLRLQRTVAVRQIARSVVQDPRRFEDLRHAASLMANLSHPHCVEIYALFDDARTPLLVMEYVPGPSLQTLMADEPIFDPRAALSVLAGALEGLSYTHSRGVVHGKLTPSNVLITEQGDSKITDVGIGSGKKLSAEELGYLAPETLAGAAPTRQSDLYAVGAALFAMTSGRPPFPVSSRRSSLNARKSVPVLPVHAHPVITSLIAASMNPDPASRPASADVFLASLEAAAVESFGPQWRVVGQAATGGLAAAAVTAGQIILADAPAAAATLFAATPAVGAGTAAAVAGPAAAVAAAGGAKVLAGIGGAAVLGAVGVAALGSVNPAPVPPVASVQPALTSMTVEGSSAVTQTMTVSGQCQGTVDFSYVMDIPRQKLAFDDQLNEYSTVSLSASRRAGTGQVSLAGLTCDETASAKIPAAFEWPGGYSETYRMTLGAAATVTQAVRQDSQSSAKTSEYTFGMPVLASASTDLGTGTLMSCAVSGAVAQILHTDDSADCRLLAGETVTVTMPVTISPDVCYLNTPIGRPAAVASCSGSSVMTLKIEAMPDASAGPAGGSSAQDQPALQP